MHGTNVISKPFKQKDELLVNSIWPTIQGEGPDVGRVAIFIRLSRCNLACHFCDTEFETGTWMNMQAVIDRIKQLADTCRAKLVVVTGGEPLLQNLPPLIFGCNKNGLAVAIETAGTLYQSGLQHLFVGGKARWKGNIIVCSPKTPKINTDLMPLIGAYKYIIKAGETSEVDGLPIRSTQREGEPAQIFRASRERDRIYVQPMDEGDEEKNKINLREATLICMRFGYRLSYQLHKLIGMP